MARTAANAHLKPKTPSQFKSYLKQASTTVLSDDGDRQTIRRKGTSTEQWSLQSGKWVLKGFS